MAEREAPRYLMSDPELDSLLPARTWDRRAFVRTSLGSGFAAAVLPVAAQSVVKTDTSGLVAGEVTVQMGALKMPAYAAAPLARPDAPVVLVVSEIFGVHEHIADIVRRLAKAGYYAIAPELFIRHGDPMNYGEVAKLLSEVVAKAADAQVCGDLDACVAFAKAQGADTGKLAITGFCWGGRIVWAYAAHNPKLDAGVAWYGPLARSYFAGDRTAIEQAARIKAPVLGLYGGDDAGIPLDGVEQMRAALKAGGNTRSEIVVYPGMPHAFHADYRATYRKEAAEDGWRRMLAWFKRHNVA
jgi:carboxymethylenebutenolidase